mmetsp:Transcript_154934/g.496547  ORF Transcript_154934/g.496547 Transcript_154934/m.496547 type:complete len:207 (-) Transcript_154934:401-1021(-)
MLPRRNRKAATRTTLGGRKTLAIQSYQGSRRQVVTTSNPLGLLKIQPWPVQIVHSSARTARNLTAKHRTPTSAAQCQCGAPPPEIGCCRFSRTTLETETSPQQSYRGQTCEMIDGQHHKPRNSRPTERTGAARKSSQGESNGLGTRLILAWQKSEAPATTPSSHYTILTAMRQSGHVRRPTAMSPSFRSFSATMSFQSWHHRERTK